MSANDGEGARTEWCAECREEIVTEPDWADRHVHVEVRYEGGTGLTTYYFCSTKCASGYLETHFGEIEGANTGQ